MHRFFSDGDVILFQGDSVTDADRNRDPSCTGLDAMGHGYPRVFQEIYDKLFPNHQVKFINRGISGNRIEDLLHRYEEDFLAVQPGFISLMIGINDTWHDFPDNNTPTETFALSYELLLQKLKRDLPNTKLLILEQFAMLSHPERSDWGKDLKQKRKITKHLAETYADYYIPLFDIFSNAEKEGFTLEELAADGVHPAPIGHSLIAAEILKCLEIV